jgi:hypothetical protein
MVEKNFWENDGEEVDNLKMGTTYPPVRVFLTAIDIARLNSLEPVVTTIILSDGKEVDLEIFLETDRNKFAKDLREALDEKD